MSELQALNLALTALSALLGAAFGSFINAASLRYAAGQGFVTGRSRCPFCGRVLPWYDLVPVASWLLLAGRCRGCKAGIPVRYWLAEMGAGGGFVLAYLAFGFTWATPLAMAVFGLLMAVALIDLATTEIPDGLNIALAVLAVASIWLMPGVSLLSRVIGFFAVSGFMFVMALALPGAFGGGDIKLMAACGFMLGWQSVLLAFFAALVLGGGYAIWAVLVRKKRGAMVFGPALCAGVFFGLLYADFVLAWYLGLLGF